MNDLPQGPLSDPRQGEHMCQNCGSNNQPTAWCYQSSADKHSLVGDIVCEKCQKDKGECSCTRGPMPGYATPNGDGQTFKVTDLPGPPVNEGRLPRCDICGSLNHYGAFGCPEWGKKNDWNPGSKKEWLGMGSGQAGRRYRR